GVTGDADARLLGSSPEAGTTWCVALLSALDQDHRSVPLRTRSDSPRDPRSASRTWLGPAYHSRRVCDPATSEVMSELPLPPMPGRLGSPRSAFCTMVPDRPSRRACWTSTRRSAAV